MHGSHNGVRGKKNLIDYVKWIADPQSVTCGKCIDNHEMIEETPDCDNCKAPVLWESNQEVFEIYELINNKFVYDFGALPFVFEALDLKMTKDKRMKLLKKMIVIHQAIADVNNPDKK